MSDVDIDTGQMLEAINNKVDLNQLNTSEAGISNVISWVMPDYSAGVTFTANVVHTATYDMICCFNRTWTTAGGGNYIWIYDENENLLQTFHWHLQPDGTVYIASAGTVIIPKGFKFKTDSTVEMSFYPLKGVS